MYDSNEIAGQRLERIKTLDVLRGFALLGIFLVNIEYFNRPFEEFGQGIPAGTVGIDYAVARMTEIFVTGKFWVLFSMLFGMGFVVMQTKANLDGRPFKTLYLRRTVALMLFGLLHIGLFWSGDILHSYALVAFVLMWFPLMQVRASGFLGASLYLAPAFLMLLSGLLMSMMPQTEKAKMAADSAAAVLPATEVAQIYAHGTYLEVMQQRWWDFLHVLSFEPFVFISALGIFLIGAAIMRSGRLLDLVANRKFFLSSMLACGGLAAVLIGLSSVFHGNGLITPKGMIEQALIMTGNLPLSLFYLSSIAYLMSFATGSKILGFLAPAGRMALTNYLMQSVIGSLVFYGYGLGLWMHWGRAQLALFVVLVFIAQLIFSHVWLSYFRYGPMEWLWRALTYWAVPPMRIVESHKLAQVS